METIKMGTAKITNNPIGAIGGGVLTYYGLKKSGKVKNMWALIGLSVVGAYAGAFIQSKVTAAGSK